MSATAIVVFVATLVTWAGQMRYAEPEGQHAQALATTTPAQAIDYFAGASHSIVAKAAYVKDTSDGRVLYEQDASEQLPLASLTKIMTAIVAIDTLPSSLVVEIAPEDLLEDGDSGLFAYERWRLTDLLDYTLMVSSNDGAHAIARTAGMRLLDTSATTSDPVKIFVEHMNAKAREIGLEHTYFLNPTGLDVDSGVSGAYGTAADVARLATYAMVSYPGVFDSTTRATENFESMSGFTHVATNTHALPNTVSGIAVSKTGYTDLAGGNLVVVFEVAPLHPIVAVALGSTEDERFTDIYTLADAAIRSFSGKSGE